MQLVDTTSFIQPFGVQFDLAAGTMEGFTRTTTRRASAMRGHYLDTEAFEALVADGDPLHYRTRVRGVFIDGVEVKAG